jgi:asparagine synthase (glutamine-hydrolysing)
MLNGEIYNYRELARTIGLRSGRTSDTLVAAEHWSRSGAACLSHFRGMYALAVVDTLEDTLTLARDPFGIKPLFCGTTKNGAFVFASEPRALIPETGPPILDEAAIASFLHFGSLPMALSPYKGITALPPNSAIQFSRGNELSATDIMPPLFFLDRAEGTAGQEPSLDLGRALQNSVDKHLRSDVPSALLLSGGVDSAAIAYVAQELGHQLSCLTVAGVSGIHDEVAVATTTARTFGHRHQVVPAALSPDDVTAFFQAMQRPTVDGLNTFVVCKAVKEAGFKVALSGLGADEALGGYSHFRTLRWLPLLRLSDHVVPSAIAEAIGSTAAAALGGSKAKARDLFSGSGPRSSWALDTLQRRVFTEAEVTRLTGSTPPPIVPSTVDARGGGPLKELVAAEVELYLRSRLLPDADAYSMAHSIELRVPFVDPLFFPRAVEETARRKGYLGKRVLVESLGNDWLRTLTRRPKTGFTIPLTAWTQDGPLAHLVGQAADPAAPLWTVLDRPSALPLLAPGAPAAAGGSRQWALVVLNAWMASVQQAARLDSSVP